MRDWIIAVASALPPQFATALIAALPLTEMRASIPLALTVFHLPITSAVFYSVLGNIIPIPILLAILPPCLAWARRQSPRLNSWLDRYFDSLRTKHKAAYERWGSLFLALIAMVPLPGAGIWSGCLLAVVFGIHWRHSALALTLGSVLGAGVILLITQGALGAFSFVLD